MADNRDLTALTGNVAADEATYSGDTSVVQLVKPVMVTGSEGSKTITALDANTGNASAGTQRVVLASDQPPVAATQSGTWNVTNVSGTVSLPTGAATLAEQQTQTTALQLIDDTVATLGTTTYTEATTKGLVIGAVRRDADTTLANTTNEIAPLQVDANGRLKVEVFSGEALPVSQSGTWTVQPGNTANTTPWLITPTPATSGGLSTFRSIDLDETEEDVKTSAGQVFGYYIANLAGSVRFVKFYNATAANVTVGSTTPVWTLPIPAGAAANVEFSQGVSFSTAISVAATTGVADNDTGAPGANECVINVFYK